jgi:hypothetical protein
MSLLELCARIQDMWVSRSISESTWGYPVVGALHVLAIALFGGTVLIPHVRRFESAVFEVRWIRRVGVTLIVFTGTLLFASGALRYYNSASFRIKMALLALIVLNTFTTSQQNPRKLHSAIAMVLWAAVVFAARGIAFF